jgi:hypothetical protein
VSYYVYYNQETLAPVSVSGRKVLDPELGIIEIDTDLGEALIRGYANIIHYFVSYDDQGNVRLVKKTRQALTTFSRIASLQLKHLTEEIPKAPIQVQIDHKKQEARIHYDGALLQYNPFKLYFTKEDDPTYLLCAVHLDVNTLDEIIKQNGIKRWPNPLAVKLPPTDDLSIYSLKTPIQISITHKNKKNGKARNNRVRYVLPLV